MFTNRSVYIPIFLRKVCEFVDKLEDRFPNESDIGYLKTAIDIAKKAHPELVVKSYIIYVYKYKEQIKLRDEEFLLTEKYNEVASTAENQTEAYLKIDHFKKLFKSESMDEVTKKSIWAYLDLLNKIIIKIQESNELS